VHQWLSKFSLPLYWLCCGCIFHAFILFGFCISGTKVGRTTELPKPEDVIEQLDIRTIAASPFEYDVTQEDLENFLGQFSKVLIAPCHCMFVRN
jgi:hypothetical protein